MKKLPAIVRTKGTRFKENYATLLERSGNVCIYQREDGYDYEVYEIFSIQIETGRKVFGKTFPERESYPSNSDFGKTAWCITNRERAFEKYMELLNNARNKASKSESDVEILLEVDNA